MMAKFKLERDYGQYATTYLEAKEAKSLENQGYCVVEVSEETSLEWERHQEESKKWNKFWNELSNQWHLANPQF